MSAVSIRAHVGVGIYEITLIRKRAFIHTYRILFTMSSLTKENQEALAQIEKLRAKAWEEQVKENWDESMHSYEKCAHALVEVLKSTPQSYHKSIQLSINKTLTKMDEIIKITAKSKEPKLSDLAINKKVKDSLTVFLDVIEVSIEEDLPYEDSTLLLYGPAGTGKNHIASAIASQLGAPLIIVKPAEARSKWSGESEKYIRDIFIKAKKERAVLFFDELHKLIRSENGEESNVNADMENQFLQEMNTRDKSFVIIGATARPWDLAETVRRRFQECTYIPPPNSKERGALMNSLIQSYMPKYSTMVTKEEITKLTETMEDYSADECRKVVSLAFRFAIKGMKDSNYFTKVNFLNSLKTYYVACKNTHPKAEKLTRKECPGQCNPVVTVKYLKKALKEIKPRIKDEDIRQFEDYKNAV